MRFVHVLILLAFACLPIAVCAQTSDKPETRSDAKVAPDGQKGSEDLKDADAKHDDAKSDDADDEKDGGKTDDGKDRNPKVKQKDKDLRRATESLRKAADEKAEKAYNQSYERSVLNWMQASHATVKGAWIGISTSPAAPALRKQLKLPDGTGLVVDFVEPKSPAEQAGIRQYDLLEKLDDQLLINSEQFAVLVRTFKPGEEVKLSVVREGKRQTISVKLGEHELPRLMELPNQFFQPMAPQPAPGAMPATPPAVRFGLEKLDAPAAITVPSESSLTWLDGKQAITITTRDGHSTLTASEGPSGKVLYTRPIDTKEQRATLPREVRDKLSLLKLPDLEGERADVQGAPKPADVPASPAPDARSQERGR